MPVREQLLGIIREGGAHNMGMLPVSGLKFEPSFRELCKANTCRNYGKFYTCPPAAGGIDDLIAQAKSYRDAILYQTVWPLEDSFDAEGMAEAGRMHYDIAQRIAAALPRNEGILHLATGGCRLCRECALVHEEPCIYPEQALTSMSAYGIHVSSAAKLAGLKYINGTNTVTFFGMVFWGKADDTASPAI